MIFVFKNISFELISYLKLLHRQEISKLKIRTIFKFLWDLIFPDKRKYGKLVQLLDYITELPISNIKHTQSAPCVLWMDPIRMWTLTSEITCLCIPWSIKLNWSPIVFESLGMWFALIILSKFHAKFFPCYNLMKPISEFLKNRLVNVEEYCWRLVLHTCPFYLNAPIFY